MLWWMVPHKDNTVPVPPGGTETAVFNCPAEGGKETAIKFCQANKLGMAGVRYQLVPLVTPPGDEPFILARQVNTTPRVDATAVQAAMTAPHGTRGQDNPSGELDPSGFQQLGDAALPVGGDGDMFGDVRDGTYLDLIQTPGGGFAETPRILPKDNLQ